LRWQLNFGLGVVGRLKIRLEDLKAGRETDPDTTALVVHHESEIFDWFEEMMGYRPDGSKTKEQREREEKDEELKRTDPEAYYKKYPYRKPKTAEEEAERARESAERMNSYRKEQEKKDERRRKRYGGKPGYDADGFRIRWERHDWVKSEQGATARGAGRSAADKVNLSPFLQTGHGKGKLPG